MYIPWPLKLVLLHLLLSSVSAHLPHTPLTTPLINCPCTFKLSRPTYDDTPFTIIVLTPASQLSLLNPNPNPNPNPTPHPLTRHNLTNDQADYNTPTTAFFHLSIPHSARYAITIESHSNTFNMTHFTHTSCPTLLGNDPPGLFRQKIVGGSTASPDLRDYLAYLHNPVTGRACTGTIVAPRWVITAAHCDVSQQDIAYIRGDQARQGVPYRISRVDKHFLYKDITYAPYDIAVVKLATRVTQVRLMRVSVNGRVPIPSSAARVVGYGSVAFDTNSEGVLFEHLRQVDVPVVAQRECMAAYSSISEVFQVCAGYLGKGGCDSCQGDSGGPLIQYDDGGEPVLVGVVSRGIRCGEARYPGIYVRVSAFEKWLDLIIGQYNKANNTRAVLAVTGSSRATFRKLLVPIGGVCGAAVVVGIVVLVVVKVRRRKVGKKSSGLEESGDNEDEDEDEDEEDIDL